MGHPQPAPRRDSIDVPSLAPRQAAPAPAPAPAPASVPQQIAHPNVWQDTFHPGANMSGGKGGGSMSDNPSTLSPSGKPLSIWEEINRSQNARKRFDSSGSSASR